MKRFIVEFDEALASELEALVDLRIYKDEQRLTGGDFFNGVLAKGLCESVCMIMVFTPTYFNSRHTYCTREYLAMKELEDARLARPETGPAAAHGLIIPVVLRDFEQLPDEIRSVRQVYRFEQFATSDRRIVRNPQYLPDIQKIARYVAARCRDLAGLDPDCDDFELPYADAALLHAVRLSGSPPAFPGRTA
jgi:hypothetical protein